MLFSAKHLYRFRVRCTDGDVGRVIGFVFDDLSLDVRFLLVRKHRLFGRKILLDPHALKVDETSRHRLHVDLTTKQIADSPDGDPAIHALKESILLGRSSRQHRELVNQEHLWATAEIFGYAVKAKDEPAGRLDDLVLDTEDWKLSGFVLRTKGLLSGVQVAFPPEWVRSIDSSSRTVTLNVDRKRVAPLRDRAEMT